MAIGRRALILAALELALGIGGVTAQAWPVQPIRLIVPFAPGGTTDIVARLLASALQERLRVAVVVENRPGAGATVGAEAVARAAADGHTLMISNIASHAISPAVYRGRIRYDPLADFTHIALLISNPSVWVAHRDSGIRSLADAVARARSPRGLDIATSGAGSSNHLLVVRMSQLIGHEINHVPFRGAGPAMQAVIAGQVPMMSDSLPSASTHIRQGTVIAVAMAAAERHPAFPEVPTFREQGYDVTSQSWFGLSGPAGLSAAVVARLHTEVSAFLANPAVRARFAELGGTPGTLGPQEFSEFIRHEVAYWGPLVAASGATAE